VSSIAITGGVTGTGTVILLAPNTNTNKTLTLPDVTDTVAGIAATQTLTNKTLTSPTLTTPNIDSAQFATVSGTAPIYPCRAWVNFNGTGTVAIRASGNVTSITDNGTGNYTVNFTTAMPDADFAAVCIAGTGASANQVNIVSDIGRSTTTFALLNASTTGAGVDRAYINVVIFR
jgi:hypothetical protein